MRHSASTVCAYVNFRTQSIQRSRDANKKYAQIENEIMQMTRWWRRWRQKTKSYRFEFRPTSAKWIIIRFFFLSFLFYFDFGWCCYFRLCWRLALMANVKNRLSLARSLSPQCSAAAAAALMENRTVDFYLFCCFYLNAFAINLLIFLSFNFLFFFLPSTETPICLFPFVYYATYARHNRQRTRNKK